MPSFNPASAAPPVYSCYFMCGRITQHRSMIAYAMEMGWDVDAFGRPAEERAPNWNVPPGSQPLLMHRFGGRERIDAVKWGYRPAWAADKGLPVSINARIEKAAHGAYFRALFKSGRAIVPADGWYEWTGPPGQKQPWYIRNKDDRPMFMAAITNFRPDRAPDDDTGFVIVTAPSEGGMVDVHDRRPLVFAAADAALWIDNSLPSEQAEQLALGMAVPVDAFEWYRVGRAVNRVGSNDQRLIEPLDE